MNLFLSHSSKDIDFIEPFVDFLIRTFPISRGDIYCTSLKGQIKIGDNFIYDIRSNIQNASSVIFLISEEYLDSLYCIMEMGAAWAYKDNIIPILIPPVTVDRLKKSPLSNTQCYSLSNTEDVAIALYSKFSEMRLISNMSVAEYGPLKESARILSRKLSKILEFKNFSKTAVSCASYISVAENGNPESLTFTRNSNTFSVNLSFCPNSAFVPEVPRFVSLVGQFYPHQDWSILHNSKYYLHLSLSTPNNSVDSVTIEIKHGDRPNTIITETLSISDSIRDVYIKPDDSLVERIRHISELCFVVRPKDMKAPYGNMLVTVHGIEKKS